MKRLYILIALVAIVSCTPKTQEQHLRWLYASMPLPDTLCQPRSFWEENVSKTLEVRKKMNWNIPQREFLHFVLPLRVNNETLDDFRTTYADTLCNRVKGMDIARAAIEINHWCHEQVTYRPSDARTLSPMALIKCGLGRCGEESVLAVAALRAAGIPARQVYTPRWAHTDDNHAWVEVWVDGKWHFLGACEPEPRLDMAWFNGPVSRAMILDTKVAGRYRGDEDIIRETPVYTEINAIKGYVPSRLTSITVTDTTGRAVAGATVAFKIYNYAEFYTVARCTTDNKGKASLNTGCGDILAMAWHDDRFGYVVAGKEDNTLVLDHRLGEVFCDDLDITPPDEHPIETSATTQEREANAARLAFEDSLRLSKPHTNPAIQDFLAGSNDPRASVLVNMLCRKDADDISIDVLEDALLSDGEDPYVLNPRISLEQLRPFRRMASDISIGSPCEAAEWIKDNIKIIEGRNPQNLPIPPSCVLSSGISDINSLKIFFAALCRAKNFPARVDEVTGKAQYRSQGKWIDVLFTENDTGEKSGNAGKLVFSCQEDSSPLYYRHFTISRVESGSDRLMEFGTDADLTPLESFSGGVSLEEGYYCLTTGNRLASGKVLAHIEFFNISQDKTAEVPVKIRKAETEITVVGNMNADPFLEMTGRGYFLLAVLGNTDEPSSHARSELQTISKELDAWGRPVVILGDGPELPSLSNVHYGSDENGTTARELADGCRKTSVQLPIITVCDSFGRIVYFSQGYNTSLSSELLSIIEKL